MWIRSIHTSSLIALHSQFQHAKTVTLVITVMKGARVILATLKFVNLTMGRASVKLAGKGILVQMMWTNALVYIDITVREIRPVRIQMGRLDAYVTLGSKNLDLCVSV